MRQLWSLRGSILAAPEAVQIRLRTTSATDQDIEGLLGRHYYQKSRNHHTFRHLSTINHFYRPKHREQIQYHTPVLILTPLLQNLNGCMRKGHTLGKILTHLNWTDIPVRPRQIMVYSKSSPHQTWMMTIASPNEAEHQAPQLLKVSHSLSTVLVCFFYQLCLYYLPVIMSYLIYYIIIQWWRLWS